jgi:tetratricopeptide (TPR) repeat protein
VFITIIGIGATRLGDGSGDDDSPASDSDASESSETPAEPTPSADDGGEGEDVSSADEPSEDAPEAVASADDAPPPDTDDLVGFVGGGSGFNMRGDELLAESDVVGAAEQFEQALASYQAAIDAYGDVEDVAVAAAVADAYNGKGFALERLGRGPEAMESYQATEDNYGSRSEPEIQSAVAFALYSRATLLAAAGQTDAAGALFMTVIERYSTAEDEGVRLWADLASTSLSFL